jgi:hypothetical protein
MLRGKQFDPVTLTFDLFASKSLNAINLGNILDKR